MLPVDHVRCSALSRAMKCRGFLFLKDLPEQETNAAAEEGTAAGELLAHMLTQRTLEPNIPTHAKNGVEFDSDMYFYTRPIAQEILLKGVQVLCETRIDWPTRSGIEIRGSYDIGYMVGTTLHIEDLKYGWGIVDVNKNWQLLGYAIGEYFRLQRLGVNIESIVLKIHQPRPHHEDGTTREWLLTPGDLMVYRAEIEDHFFAVAQGDNTLTTGPQCKYCAGAAKDCPAFSRVFYSAIDVALANPKQDSLTEEEIAKQLELLERVGEVFKIKNDSLQSLAMNRIKGGKIIKGWTVDKNYGDRKWKKDISPDVIETLTGKKIVEQVMLSPAKAEKLGVSKKLVESLVEQHFIGLKLKRKNNDAEGDKIFGAPPTGVVPNAK